MPPINTADLAIALARASALFAQTPEQAKAAQGTVDLANSVAAAQYRKAMQKQAEKEQKQGTWKSIGSLAGGILGAPLGPVGAAVGAGLGGGAAKAAAGGNVDLVQDVVVPGATSYAAGALAGKVAGAAPGAVPTPQQELAGTSNLAEMAGGGDPNLFSPGNLLDPGAGPAPTAQAVKAAGAVAPQAAQPVPGTQGSTSAPAKTYFQKVGDQFKSPEVQGQIQAALQGFASQPQPMNMQPEGAPRLIDPSIVQGLQQQQMAQRQMQQQEAHQRLMMAIEQRKMGLHERQFGLEQQRLGLQTQETQASISHMQNQDMLAQAQFGEAKQTGEVQRAMYSTEMAGMKDKQALDRQFGVSDRELAQKKTNAEIQRDQAAAQAAGVSAQASLIQAQSEQQRLQIAAEQGKFVGGVTESTLPNGERQLMLVQVKNGVPTPMPVGAPYSVQDAGKAFMEFYAAYNKADEGMNPAAAEHKAGAQVLPRLQPGGPAITIDGTLWQRTGPDTFTATNAANGGQQREFTLERAVNTLNAMAATSRTPGPPAQPGIEKKPVVDQTVSSGGSTRTPKVGKQAFGDMTLVAGGKVSVADATLVDQTGAVAVDGQRFQLGIGPTGQVVAFDPAGKPISREDNPALYKKLKTIARPVNQ